MGTLKVDNLQKEDGTAIITDGVIPTTILRSSSVGMVLLEEKNVVSGSAAAQPFHFQNIFSSTYRSYKAIYTVKETESSANDTNCGLIVRLGTGGTLSTGTSSTVKHSCHYIQGDANQNSVVYGDSDDLLVFCQNFSNNEDMLAMGTC